MISKKMDLISPFLICKFSLFVLCFSVLKDSVISELLININSNSAHTIDNIKGYLLTKLFIVAIVKSIPMLQTKYPAKEAIGDTITMKAIQEGISILYHLTFGSAGSCEDSSGIDFVSSLFKRL